MDAIRQPSDAFVTTRWTRVLSARGGTPEAGEALSGLCAAYYSPVHAFIRRATRHEEDARDLTQEFFSRILARQGLDNVEQSGNPAVFQFSQGGISNRDVRFIRVNA